MGVAATLQWLTDTPDAQPPLPLPRRGRSGAVATEAQVYAQLKAEAGRQLRPWERAALRRETHLIAARSRRFADLIVYTVRRVHS